jgi:hypothetical protein
MDDLISRKAAIDAILAVTGNSSVRELYEHVQEHGLSEMWSGGVNAAIDIIIAVPSAQPEPIKINIDDFNKEDLERFKKELGNTPITVLPAQPEIIRCRECKLRDTEYCNMAHGFMGMKDDDYCSYAERREESE